MTMKKRRLGKGLDSLIGPSASNENDENSIMDIPLSRIELNPFQPRQDIDDEALEELAESIRNTGILQPVVVRGSKDGMYELIMGERRLRASRRAGLERVPAILKEVEDRRMLELALVENVQRQDLNAIEKAMAIATMCEELGLTQEEVADRLGLKRPTVANLIRLLELPDEIKQLVSRGTLSAGHARALLGAGDDTLIISLAKQIVKNGLSVRETEKIVSDRTNEKKRRPAGTGSPHLHRLQKILEDTLSARVKISARGKKGSITIHFTDNDEFERLFTNITGFSNIPA